MPTAAEGFEVGAFAHGLDHPRWIHVLPNGDVLVAESNSPGIEPAVGLRGWVMKRVMGRAGAGVPSPNRIVLLRDADGDGVAETRTTFLQGLYSPFGMALVGNNFYVANADAIVRFPYTTGATSITAQGTKLIDLPGAPLNHHWTKNIIASPDGTKLYATVGSNSNIAENGFESGRRPRGDLGDRSCDWAFAYFRDGATQSERARMGASDRGAMDGGQRARRVG